MSYTINTNKYQVRKVVEINGVVFHVRPFTTAEQLSMASIKNEVDESTKDSEDIEKITKVLNKIKEYYVALFDNKEEAEKLLNVIPMDKYSELYTDIMENAENE